jgi:hypothetical protein
LASALSALQNPPRKAPQYDWFTPGEVHRLLLAIHKAKLNDRLILVGGQALIVWMLKYDIDAEPSESPQLTQDVDFVGLTVEARQLAKLLDNASVMVPTMDDATPNSAVVTWTPQAGAPAKDVRRDKKDEPKVERKLLIDFLIGVLGVDDRDVRNLAVSVQAKDWPAIRVLHPINCLQSRLVNLHRLSNKRDSNGITQAKVAIDVVRCFIDEILASEGETMAGRAVDKVLDIAALPEGLFALQEYGIDLMGAIPIGKFDPSHAYVTMQYPRSVDKLERARKKTQGKSGNDLSI